MKTKLMVVATLFGIVSWLIPALAQVPVPPSSSQTGVLPGTFNDQSPKGTSKITGSIVDSTQGKAVEFASIALYNQTTGKAIDGTVADAKGKFTLAKLAAGNYRMLISFVGFYNKTIDNLTLTSGQTLDLGTIKLTAEVKTLSEVTVVGQVTLIEEKVDRLVYNADKDITAKGGDARDILRKVPMLTVDLDGNVSLRGSQNIRVLINNKPSTIVANSVADALKQIPADQIKTVEVITSPSAKYDAEGSGGIVNIITKKNSLQGLNLNVDSGVGNRMSLLSLNGSYRKGRTGFTVGGFGRAMYNTFFRTTLDQTSLFNGVATQTRQAADGRTSGLFGQYNLGFDHDLAKNQSLTGGIRYGVSNQSNQQELLIQLLMDQTTEATGNRHVITKNLSGTVDANVDYLHTFKPQQELSISTLYSWNDLSNNFDAKLFSSAGELGSRQRNLNKNVNQEFTLQTDYQTPIKKNQLLEVGGKAIFRLVNSNYRYLLAGPSDSFTTEVNHTLGGLIYRQNIAAGYSSYTYTTKNRYTFKGGLRYEHTFIDAGTLEGGNLAVGNYGVLVPSLNASGTIKRTTLKLGFNRRIQRPGLQQLNPNFNAANPQNITMGNPNLRPELTNNIELGISRAIGKAFMNATFFGRSTNNAITQVSQPSDTIPGALLTTYQNIGRQHTYGTNLFANVAVTSTINVGVFLNAFYSRLTGQAAGLDGTSVWLTNSGMTMSGGSFMNATFKNGWGAQAFGLMQGSQVLLQGHQVGFSFYSVGIRKEFNHKKASLGLAAENFLTNHFTMQTVLNSPLLSQVKNVNVYNRGVRLTFTLKLGKMTTNAPRKKGKSVNNDDIKNDPVSQPQPSNSPTGNPPRP